MLTRSVPAVLLLVLAFGCASPPEAGSSPSGAAGVPSGSAAPSGPAVAPSDSAPVTEPSAGLPSAARPPGLPPGADKGGGEPALGGARTITGTVAAGVEPNCLIVNADGGTHQLIFDDPALRAAAAVGRTVTLVGRSDPTMSTTCQQGVPFLVTSATASS